MSETREVLYEDADRKIVLSSDRITIVRPTGKVRAFDIRIDRLSYCDMPAEQIKVLRDRGEDPSTRFAIRWHGQALSLPLSCKPAIERAIALGQELLKQREIEKELRARRIADIEGLDELRAAREAVNRYHDEFARMMEDEYNDGVRPPKRPAADPADLARRYPRAAAYLIAESWSCAAHYAKAAAGSRAVERIISGEDHGHVLTEMESEWSDHVQQHAWD